MIQIYAVHLEDGDNHEHIAKVWWFNPKTAKFGDSSRSNIVEWVRDETNRAFVCDGYSVARVGVVTGSPPYIRTYADKQWTNNLLALPRY